MPLVLLLAAVFLTSFARAETLTFAGLPWTIRDYDGMPGPNLFSAKNAWVDAEGALHLRIRHHGGKWTCAEVIADGNFHFGAYEFSIEGPLNTLDPQVVLGLFTYPREETGPSGTHEIDIEFCRWGNPAYPNLNYTVWPVKKSLKSTSEAKEVKFPASATQHVFIWRKDRVSFASFAGKTELARWIFAPSDAADRISRAPQQLMINLWLMDGKPPADGQEVEILIRRFIHLPDVKGMDSMAR